MDLAASGLAHGGGLLSKLAAGTLEIQRATALRDNSNINVSGGTLRYNVLNGGPAVVGSGVLATVSNAAVLELAGTVAALSDGTGPHSVAVMNNSTAAAGLHVTGTNQQVGAVDGSGTTQVEASASLTANHIVQSGSDHRRHRRHACRTRDDRSLGCQRQPARLLGWRLGSSWFTRTE